MGVSVIYDIPSSHFIVCRWGVLCNYLELGCIETVSTAGVTRDNMVLELDCKQSSALIDIDTDRLRLDVVTVPDLGPVTNDDFRDAEYQSSRTSSPTSRENKGTASRICPIIDFKGVGVYAGKYHIGMASYYALLFTIALGTW